MRDAAEKIVQYQNLFLGCLILSVLCLLLTVFLFFILDIRSVLGYLTGRQARRKIRQIEELAAAGGRKNNWPDRHPFSWTDSPPEKICTAALDKTSVRGRFIVEQELLWIHTEEML